MKTLAELCTDKARAQIALEGIMSTNIFGLTLAERAELIKQETTARAALLRAQAGLEAYMQEGLV